VKLYGPKVFNLVAYMVSDVSVAEDLAQEVFLKAFKAIKFFKGDAGFYTWLYRIAVNAALSHRRSGAREQLKIDGAAREGAAHSNPAPVDPVRTAETKEKRAIVRAAISRLSAEESAVVVLRDMEGLSYAEIAESLNIPAGTVRSRLFRARMALKEILKGMLDEV